MGLGAEQPLGVVRGIEEYGGQTLLRVEKTAGGEMLVPFVEGHLPRDRCGPENHSGGVARRVDRVVSDA